MDAARCRIRKRNRHMNAAFDTLLQLQVDSNVDRKLRAEIRSAGSNVLWRPCTCMSLVVFAMHLAT